MHESQRKCLHNQIKNALVESFGYDGYKAAFESCKTSPRFKTLEAVAENSGHEGTESWKLLVRFSAKLANNPKTRAMVK